MCTDPGNGPGALASKECFPYHRWDSGAIGAPVDHLRPLSARRIPIHLRVSLGWNFETLLGLKREFMTDHGSYGDGRETKGRP